LVGWKSDGPLIYAILRKKDDAIGFGPVRSGI